MLQYGAAYSRCLRRMAAGFAGADHSFLHSSGVSRSSAVITNCGVDTVAAGAALRSSLRNKSTTIRIANRKKVEMFVGKRFHLPTRLRTAAPDIALEWDYEKNPMHLYPEIVGIGYMQPVYWVCKDCGHSFQMSVEKRVVRGGGCSECAEKALNESLSPSAAFMEAASAEGKPVLLPGEENRALRPKRSTVLNLRTKY